MGIDPERLGIGKELVSTAGPTRDRCKIQMTAVLPGGQMMDKPKIVVIGGVAAGPKVAARARRLAPAAEIIIRSMEWTIFLC
jgi:hypothetical protein